MSLEAINQGLLQSYREHGGINHLAGSNLPSQEAIDALATEFMQLLFPGFFEQASLETDDLGALIGRRLARLEERLIAELQKCMLFADGPEARARGPEVARELLRRLPAVRQLLKTDVEAAYSGDPAARSYEEIILSYPFILAISAQRIAHVLYRRNVALLPRMLTEYAHRRTGIDIHPGAQIGSHFFVDHGTGVVIGETATIGSRVKLYQGVTLGAKSFKTDGDGQIVKGIKRHPDIGDDVTIYAGATILGGDTRIGDGSIVGSNVWLMESIPPNSIAYYRGESLVVRSREAKEKAEGDNTAPRS
jgi:serine O-acetyltransferase